MLSIVVPVYNEEGAAAKLHAEILAMCRGIEIGDQRSEIGKGNALGSPISDLRSLNFEIIFVNDGSKDRTMDVLKTLTPIKIINLRKNFGQTQGQVKLTLNGGPDATYMTVSNSPIADNATREVYVPTKVWNVGNGAGDKNVYVRYYNVCGFPTPIINHRFPYTWPFGGIKGPTPPTPPKGRVLGEKITNIDALIAETKYGEKSDNVTQLQDALKSAGFFPASVKSTGFYGPITRAAVQKYLANNATLLSADANLDTLVADLSYGMRNASVVRLQDLLKGLGFFPKTVRSTGYFGPITKGAVAKFIASK